MFTTISQMSVEYSATLRKLSSARRSEMTALLSSLELISFFSCNFFLFENPFELEYCLVRHLSAHAVYRAQCVVVDFTRHLTELQDVVVEERWYLAFVQ